MDGGCRLPIGFGPDGTFMNHEGIAGVMVSRSYQEECKEKIDKKLFPLHLYLEWPFTGLEGVESSRHGVFISMRKQYC
ncbi:hypothetical protein TorRG33x02_153970 [Trema orientale]|uniref:Uncharacterized protein n=1 Tax=Trema orientale TaxID=63057 RepID=A0A2P5ET19_TREOI|nr:hypothetical protein TorRG33x02_153970 [Trema orientale]